MSKVQDEYILEREIKDEKFHIRVFRPVLTEEEKERRMKHLKRTTEKFMKTVIAAQKGEINGT